MNARWRAAALAAMALPALVAEATPQTGAGYDLRWNTQDAGGSAMNGPNGYALAGTVGQPDPLVAPAGAGFVLRGGFWPGAHAAGDAIFGDDFENVP